MTEVSGCSSAKSVAQSPVPVPTSRALWILCPSILTGGGKVEFIAEGQQEEMMLQIKSVSFSLIVWH